MSIYEAMVLGKAFDRLCELTGAETVEDALKAVQAMLEGYPASRPPDSTREVLVLVANRTLALGCYFHTCPIGWRINGRRNTDIVQWWELPVSRRNNDR